MTRRSTTCLRSDAVRAWKRTRWMMSGTPTRAQTQSPPAAGAALLIFLVAVVLASPLAHGEPYIPKNDAVVLERLPAGSATRQLEPLRRAVQRNPQDLRATLQLAQGYLQIGRETSDPRFNSYAQAALAPWMQQPDPPAPVLVLEATALQSLHRFDESLALLDRALAMDPGNAQALLTKANLLQLKGDFNSARSACRRLALSAEPSAAYICMASVDSMTGRLESSYRALQRMARGSADADPALMAWMRGQLGEMAVRLGERRAAQTHFEEALELTPDDPYLLAVYADLLLLEGRHQAVIELLRDRASSDALLLRLAIAAHRAGDAEAARWSELFDARRRATRPDVNPHLREHARFALDVLDQPQRALALARSNWENQREPADVRLYWRAARLAGAVEDERRLQAWMRATAYEDSTLLAE